MILNYAAFGAAFAAVLAVAHEVFKNGLRRRGIARVLYHRLLQRQSTLAIAYYRRSWWSDEEIRESDLDDDDLKRVATALAPSAWRLVNSALGWMEHLQARRRGRTGLVLSQEDHDQIRDVYERLELARWALRRVAGRVRPLPWDVHKHENMQEWAEQEGYGQVATPLRNATKRTCKAALRKRRRSDPMPSEPVEERGRRLWRLRSTLAARR
jgi:hypothetical protein